MATAKKKLAVEPPRRPNVKAQGAAKANGKGAHTPDVNLSDRPADGHATESRGDQQGNNFVERGRDVLSGEAGGLATAAAIGVGAALISVELIPGLILGAGAILFGKLFPEIGSYVRPAVKNLVRTGFAVTQKARELAAEANEQAHDLLAEVKHERAQQPHHAAQKPNPKHNGAMAGSRPRH
jgi:hypothetical protein